MMSIFIRYIKGYVKLRVSGNALERFMNLCRFHRMNIWSIRQRENYIEMCMSVQDFRKVRPLFRKTHVQIRIVRRFGLPFILHRYQKRRTLLFGFLLCILMIILLSTHVWCIDFAGNRKISDTDLLRFLRQNNICSGMKKNQVDCAQIVKLIRRQYDDIVWVSASQTGSEIKIQIKENENTGIEKSSSVSADGQENQNGSDLIAGKDGEIISIITRKGIPQIHEGDTVKKGDLLVLGRIEVRNDSDEIVAYRYENSEADIQVATTINYHDSIPSQFYEKEYVSGYSMRLKVLFGDNRVCFPGGDGIQKNTEYLSVIHPLYLNASFPLPVTVEICKARKYQLTPKNHSKSELQRKLSANFSLFCEELEKKGVQITSNSVKIHIGKTDAAAEGTLNCIEDITTPASTERININESLGNHN
ncbi:sporulation protein YqfD [Hespellia stercorisuis]|uniref:Similar to stage IV sporulation protein n=1 Tax=Hespellia stercorisuis DSM 15480 TaxID=1121950 RepID=A0A1M6N574_9FIRM|nr:sporulation protein YqfD [Hespellia stercorisuis]SHJ90834.1 similar to stage IV sporulation protein [Hespellia stercorisuis DSM 15480]